MELNDIIKSNEFLISLYVGLILLISFIIYKIRNKAKKKEETKFRYSKPDNGNVNDKEKKKALQNLNDKSSSFENNTSNNFTEYFREKFVVINKMHEDKADSDSRLKREQGFKEFYEITDSKFMFKFNPHPENASEE